MLSNVLMVNGSNGVNMPTYEYECKKCNEIIEVKRSMTEEPLTECECGEKGELCQIISGGLGFKVHGGTPRFHYRRSR